MPRSNAGTKGVPRLERESQILVVASGILKRLKVLDLRHGDGDLHGSEIRFGHA